MCDTSGCFCSFLLLCHAGVSCRAAPSKMKSPWGHGDEVLACLYLYIRLNCRVNQIWMYINACTKQQHSMLTKLRPYVT